MSEYTDYAEQRAAEIAYRFEHKLCIHCGEPVERYQQLPDHYIALPCEHVHGKGLYMGGMSEAWALEFGDPIPEHATKNYRVCEEPPPFGCRDDEEDYSAFEDIRDFENFALHLGGIDDV